MLRNLLLALFLICVCIPARSQSGTPEFPDIPRNHWAYGATIKATSASMVEGFSDGNFYGNKPLTRYECAALVARFSERTGEWWRRTEYQQNIPPAPIYKDVSPNHWAYHAVSAAYLVPVMRGYEDGTFRGENFVTRYHLAFILSRFAAMIDPRSVDFKLSQSEASNNFGHVKNTSIFQDVPSNHWATNAIKSVLSTLLMEGFVDDTFRGDMPATRYEMMAGIARSLERIRVCCPSPAQTEK